MSTIPNRGHAKGGPPNEVNLNNEAIEALKRAMLEQQNQSGNSANQTQHFAKSNQPSYSSNNPYLHNSGLARSKNLEQLFVSPLLGITHIGRRNLQPTQKLNNSGLASSNNLEQQFVSPLLGITHVGRRN